MVAKQLEAFRGRRAHMHSPPSAAQFHGDRGQTARQSNFSQAKPVPDLQLDLFDPQRKLATVVFSKVPLGHSALHFSLHRAISIAWGRLQQKGYCRNVRPSHSALDLAEAQLGNSGRRPGELPRIFKDLRMLLHFQSAARLFGHSVLSIDGLKQLQKSEESHEKSANATSKEIENSQTRMHTIGNSGGAFTRADRNAISGQDSRAKALEETKYYHQRLQSALHSVASSLIEFAGAPWAPDLALASELAENGGKKTEIIVRFQSQKKHLSNLLLSPAQPEHIRRAFASGEISIHLSHDAAHPMRPDIVIYYSSSAKVVSNSINEGTLSHSASEKVMVLCPILPDGVPD